MAIALLGLGPACDKSNPPGGGGGAGDEGGADGGTDAPVEGGKDYVYAPDGFALTATTKIKLEISSTQGAGDATLAVRSAIEATPTSDGNFEVHGRVLELIDYTGGGQLDPEFMRKQAEEQGQDPIDIVAELSKSEAWMIIDAKGSTDSDATEKMAQNQDQDDAPLDFGLFSLPDLPTVDLELGKRVELPTADDERQLPFGAVPVETDKTWTLRAVDGTVVELDLSSEGSGATEIDAQGQTILVSVLEESSYTVFFNLETKLPVSFNGYSASEISVDMPGNPIKFATNNEIEATFEVGVDAAATAPAEDVAAPAADAAAPAEGG